MRQAQRLRASDDGRRRQVGWLQYATALGSHQAAYALALPAQWAINRWGWRGAFWAYVIAIAAVIPWAWIVHPTRLHSAAKAGPTAGVAGERTVASIVASPGFWSLLVVFSTPPLFGYLAITQHTLYFTARGFSAAEASLMLALGGGLAGCGRALAGWVADHLGGPVVGVISFSCSLVGMLCLLGMEAWPGRLLAAGYVLFLFLPLGSRATIVSVLISRIAPPVHYGLIFGLLGIGNSLAAAAGPWLSGEIYDHTQSYLVIYLWATAVALAGLGGLVVFCLTTRRAA